ncbi:efflux RND transporter periplasmic adaptor subunit [Desulfoluna sp.]|uniref:efflux RND transporter periplasmic adaptor subunit n=1 Tax=Desulfoluna sp. TaxID=2045199 RepID=UPI002606F213|nr:efflux RND transporter periplasmic adaptor subunit [Desulfoluna sp.]
MGWNQNIVRVMAAGLLVGMVGCSGEKALEIEAIRPVRFSEVTKAPAQVERRFSGITQAGEVVRLSFRTGGKIETLEVAVGDTVTRGQVLATLDNRDARLNLEKAQVALENSRIQSENARSNLDRIRALYENNNEPLSEYEKARNGFASASATYNADKRGVTLLERDLAYYTLESPMAGIITSREVEANENVSSGQVVAVIQSSDSIEVETGIPELWIPHIKRGQVVSILYPSMPDKRFEGRVTEVAFESDKETHTYPVILSMEGVGAEIRPGMPTSVIFEFDNKETGAMLIVPVHAVAKDYEGYFLYTVEETGKGEGVVTKRRVTVGRMITHGFEIASGLQAGEKVVTAGVSFLSDGKKVKLISH